MKMKKVKPRSSMGGLKHRVCPTPSSRLTNARSPLNLAAMHSMTGFGRGSATTDAWHATVEISSVNRKQAELVIQAPRELNELEARIRNAVLAVVSRGRIQVSIKLERAQGTAADFRINPALALAFSAALVELGDTIGQPILPTAADFLRQPGIIDIGTSEIDAEAAWLAIAPALTSALAHLAAMRESEGRHLQTDFLARLETLASLTRTIASGASDRPARQRELLLKRLRDAGLDLDPTEERVAKEIALFGDRCDISEELTRLDSHFAKFREYLDADEPPGRALDFLCQELFREFNTIGSKANDASIAQAIVVAKTELEKIREQVQNIE
jgi:uncharacterized protein (TIGR00255 family)